MKRFTLLLLCVPVIVILGLSLGIPGWIQTGMMVAIVAALTYLLLGKPAVDSEVSALAQLPQIYKQYSSQTFSLVDEKSVKVIGLLVITNDAVVIAKGPTISEYKFINIDKITFSNIARTYYKIVLKDGSFVQIDVGELMTNHNPQNNVAIAHDAASGLAGATILSPTLSVKGSIDAMNRRISEFKVTFETLLKSKNIQVVDETDTVAGA